MSQEAFQSLYEVPRRPSRSSRRPQQPLQKPYEVSRAMLLEASAKDTHTLGPGRHPGSPLEAPVKSRSPPEPLGSLLGDPKCSEGPPRDYLILDHIMAHGQPPGFSWKPYNEAIGDNLRTSWRNSWGFVGTGGLLEGPWRTQMGLLGAS